MLPKLPKPDSPTLPPFLAVVNKACYFVSQFHWKFYLRRVSWVGFCFARQKLLLSPQQEASEGLISVSGSQVRSEKLPPAVMRSRPSCQAGVRVWVAVDQLQCPEFTFLVIQFNSIYFNGIISWGLALWFISWSASVELAVWPELGLWAALSKIPLGLQLSRARNCFPNTEHIYTRLGIHLNTILK